MYDLALLCRDLNNAGQYFCVVSVCNVSSFIEVALTLKKDLTTSYALRV